MSDGVRLVDRVWFGADGTARAARLALAPLEAVYRVGVAARGALYDAGLLPSHQPAVPSVSVGNLGVGGTGKTPVAAWLAGRLRERGAHPAIVLRGYGEDEPLVHRLLNPSVPVIVAADRVAGSIRALAAGADVAVLDDAFQHRRVRRLADVVLVSADRWTPHVRLLPAGPWREPLRALRRASVVLVTRKAASLEDAERVSAALAREAPGARHGIVHLAPAELVEVEGSQRRDLAVLRGADVRVLVGIGDPRAFIRQLEALGARVTAETRPDHHHFSEAEVAAFARRVPPDAVAVCTLKDAVKLTGRWPRAGSRLWYVSQRVVAERGADAVEELLDDLVRARAETIKTAG